MAAYIWGYRVALLIATTGVISAVGAVGWHAALLGIAALIGLGLAVTLLAPEPPPAERRVVAARFTARLAHAVIEPLRDFLTRRGALLILAFVALFKLGEAMAGIMTAPFYRALGFSREAIAANGWFSLGGTLAGIALGGWLVARIGTGRALLCTGWTQTSPWRCTWCSPFGGRAPRAVRHGDHRGVRPGHGRRGVHHLPVRPLLARVHRHALCAAVARWRRSRCTRSAAPRASWRHRSAGWRSMRCACSPHCRRWG